jgi:hypothetical protein
MANIQNGMRISGTGIPSDSVIIGNDGASSIVIGNRTGSPVTATASNSGVSLAIVGERPYTTKIENNEFYNTRLYLDGMYDAKISGNLFEKNLSDVTTYGVLVNQPIFESTITNNIFRYGYSGIHIAGSGSTDLFITGNFFRYQYYYGIYAAGGAATRLTISENNITNTATSNTGSYQGIYAATGATIKNNVIDLITGYAGIRSDTNATNNIIQGNKVRNLSGGGTKYSIRIEAGNTGYVLSENQTNLIISDVSGTAVRATNNDIIP